VVLLSFGEFLGKVVRGLGGGKGETAAGTNYASLALPGADLALHEAASKNSDGRHECKAREHVSVSEEMR